uniref:X-ray radiation resistance associated 1 n=1 Tax=Xiphophorus maculatus TaxID=8083 RepID=A0A3B5QAX1_XIPMA
MNRIKNMDFDVADFPHLEVLNLSFNNLQAEDLLQFGQFPHLKTLHLTGNELSCLPPNFGPSHSDQSDMLSEEGAKQFESLEVLMLNYNSLTSSVFYNLRNLKRLKHLNLEGNHITEIPCKEVMESSKPALREGEEEDIESKIDHHIEIMEILHVLREDRCSSVLLPELQCLNLADNQIASEEAVVAAALFPKLCELHIHCNPLTTQRRGETALLTYFLQDKLGIKIKREKDEDFLQPPLKDKKRTKSDLRTIRPEDKSKGKSRENAKRFFITQTEDEAELQLASSSSQNASAQNRACPGRPVRYDMIMDVKPLPCIGIQTAVRMLDQTLRNLNIYRDSKPRLDSIQTPYSEMKKRIEELPPLRPIKQPIQRVEELLKEMKDNRATKVVSLGMQVSSEFSTYFSVRCRLTFTQPPLANKTYFLPYWKKCKKKIFGIQWQKELIQFDLTLLSLCLFWAGSVIHNRAANSKDHREALFLLRELKKTHRMVHDNTMEQEARFQCEHPH